MNIYWFEFIKGKGTRKKKHSAKITFKNGRQIYHPYRRHEEQSEKSRDEQPHLGPLVLLFPISQTYCSVSLFLSLFFLLTCQANESDPRDLLLQGPSNPIKAFQLNQTRTYSPNKYPIFFTTSLTCTECQLFCSGMVGVWRNICFQTNTSWSIFFRGTYAKKIYTQWRYT